MRAFVIPALIASLCLRCTSAPVPASADSQAQTAPALAASMSAPQAAKGRSRTTPAGPNEPTAPPVSTSTSLGSPTSGRLTRAVAMPPRGTGFVLRNEHDLLRRYGTVETVEALVHAAKVVAKRVPGGTVTFGDLSLVDGGAMGGHATHQSGRDVDVYFYLLDAAGAPFPSKGIPIEPDGAGVDYRDLSLGNDDIPVHIDLARTWVLVATLLGNGAARVNRIYVVEHVRSLLLEHANSVGANESVVEEFGAVTCQPNFPHDDHMHVRFYCALDDIDAGCEDTLPIYPWHLAYLREHAKTFKPASGRSVSRPNVTSVAEATETARREHGPFHPDVTAFLKRRRQWVTKPHPGRPYCP